jgi:hypothetical protein
MYLVRHLYNPGQFALKKHPFSSTFVIQALHVRGVSLLGQMQGQAFVFRQTSDREHL